MGAHPPAWYHDPHVEGQLRRWDGRSWTNDVRPIPPWMRGLTLAPSPPARTGLFARPLLARRLWTASTMTLALALLLLLSLLSTMRSDIVQGEKVSDTRFLSSATAACDRNARDIQQAAGNTEAFENVMERFIDELHAIEVVAADREAVERWIGWWEAWAAARYDGTRSSQAEVTARLEVNKFTFANALSTCVLDPL